ncbi:MAG: prephenate dehydrogenase [Gemmataceae bacterium]
MLDSLLLVGIGLLGGSVGMAVRRRGVARRVIGVDRKWAVLNTAKQLGVIDEGTTNLEEAIANTKFVVFCTPVDTIVDLGRSVAEHCSPGTTLTDVGSTKRKIMAELAGVFPDGVDFVGSHPLAGSEKKGVEHSNPELFQDRLTIVVPDETAPVETIEQVSGFWKAIGSRIRVMAADDHDEALALTSHLPHLVASALAGILPSEYYELAAGGFRDTTRIAASSPTIWKGIFQHNRDTVLAGIACLEKRIGQFREALERQDEERLSELLSEGKKVRDALGN